MDQNTMTEGFKAIQEASKLGVVAINNVSDLIKWGGGVMGIRDINNTYFRDKIEFTNWERQCKFANKVNARTKNQNQLIQPIPPKFFKPIFENGYLEEEEELQELWVNLLGNWTKKENIEKRRMTYIDILKNLSMQDVKILDTVYKKAQEDNRLIIHSVSDNNSSSIKDYREISINRLEIDPTLNLTIYFESINNLIRLGCLRSANTPDKTPTLEILNITYLGAGLVEACIAD